MPNALAELASTDLRYALAELEMDGSKESVARALDHIRQAHASLLLLVPELDAPPDEADGASEAA